MDAFLTRHPDRSIRNLRWIGVAAGLIIIAAIVYQWLGP
jgi:hypothetical protein